MLLSMFGKFSPPPTAWTVDLLNLTLGLGSLVRSWMALLPHWANSCCSRQASARLLVCTDTIWSKYGVLHAWNITRVLYNRSHSILSFHKTFTGNLKSVECGRSAWLVLVDFLGAWLDIKQRKGQAYHYCSGLMSTCRVGHTLTQETLSNTWPLLNSI